MITHNGWDVTNIAYFYLNPLISVIPRVFPLEQNISSCPLSLQTTNQWYLSVWPFHWLLFDKSSVSVIWFIFTRGVKSERRDNWATRVILSSIPRAPGVTSSPPHLLTILQQCPFVFISQHFVSRLLRLIMRIEDCIVNTRGEGMQVRCSERHDCIVCSQISILIWIK